ncbi:MAG: 2Fe-2S iron-sulfur cluster-binding protein [Verrucomicrobiota bacterium]
MKIDGKDIEVREGDTVLSAARRAGIEIPTLCYNPQVESNTSCMVCLVEDIAEGRLIPSCAARAEEGMEIVTLNERVREARKTALELLLSEHVGDCEAPCTRGCPAGLDIPLMIRHIEDGNMKQAFMTALNALVFPSVLGRICPAPCEKVCRRGQYDSAISILKLKRYAGDWGLEQQTSVLPEVPAATGRKVAIAGAGISGLSAAFFLRLMGHECEVLERSPQAGGTIRTGIDPAVLPERILDNEIRRIERVGARFRMRTELGSDVSLAGLQKEYDAVLIAAGKREDSFFRDMGLESDSRLLVDRRSGQTSMKGVFGCGAACGSSGMAVSAVASARRAAEGINHYLSDSKGSLPGKRLDVRIGRLKEGEMEELMKGVDPSPRVEPDSEKGYSQNQATAEAARCMHCECLDRVTCKLRNLADEYDAVFRRRRRDERAGVEKDISAGEIVFESGKCIKCGICVGIADDAAGRGLTFINRGMSVKVRAPFDGKFGDLPVDVLRKCAQSCPTGAIGFVGGEGI